MDAKSIAKSIDISIGKLMRAGLCDKANYCNIKVQHGIEKVVYSNFSDISIALKDIEYAEVYKHLDENSQYNLKLIDGAIVHLLYTFDGQGKLIKHRLCYFPSPTFEPFQNMPELYMDEGDLYVEVTAKAILPVPIRIDYDPKNHTDVVHPASHITFGQYKNCRIPVVSPICPTTFLNFLFESFYNTAFLSVGNLGDCYCFEKTITELESRRLHFSFS